MVRDLPTEPPKRLAIVDDEALLRDLLATALRLEPLFEIVATYGDPDRALKEIPHRSIDVAILDVGLNAPMNGVELGIKLRRQTPQLGVMLLTNHADPHLLAALPEDSAGGWSYMLKSSFNNTAGLVRAIDSAANGMLVFDKELAKFATPRRNSNMSKLTARQVEILALVAQGMTNTQIGLETNVSERSVENHLSRIYSELHIDTRGSCHPRVAAVLRFIEQSVQRPPQARGGR